MERKDIISGYRFTVAGYVAIEGDNHKVVHFPEPVGTNDPEGFKRKRERRGRIVDLRQLRQIR